MGLWVKQIRHKNIQIIRHKIGWIWEVGIDVGGKRINIIKRPFPNPKFANHMNFTFLSRVSHPEFSFILYNI